MGSHVWLEQGWIGRSKASALGPRYRLDATKGSPSVGWHMATQQEFGNLGRNFLNNPSQVRVSGGLYGDEKGRQRAWRLVARDLS